MIIITRVIAFIKWLFIFIILAGSIGCASQGTSSRSDTRSDNSDEKKTVTTNFNIRKDIEKIKDINAEFDTSLSASADLKFDTEKNKTNIYVYRNGLIYDVMMPVSLNGKVIAKTTSKTFLKLTMDPGLHEISSEEGGFSSVTIKTEAGKNYYVFQEIISGINATGANLQEVSESEGQLGVQECRLIKHEL